MSGLSLEERMLLATRIAYVRSNWGSAAASFYQMVAEMPPGTISPALSDEDIQREIDKINAGGPLTWNTKGRQTTPDETTQAGSAPILEVIKACGFAARLKGFDNTMHRTQVAMIATEVGEALEHITESGRPVTDVFVSSLITLGQRFEQFRKVASKPYVDNSEVRDPQQLLEGLADIVIRVFSYADANGQAGALALEIQNTLDRDASRPRLHGKAF